MPNRQPSFQLGNNQNPRLVSSRIDTYWNTKKHKWKQTEPTGQERSGHLQKIGIKVNTK